MARRTPWRELLRGYVILALAGWVGEQTSIALYAHYTYAAAWDARVLDVPALVPLIWPLVILSARDVTTHLFPWARGVARVALVGAVVSFDESREKSAERPSSSGTCRPIPRRAAGNNAATPSGAEREGQPRSKGAGAKPLTYG